MPEVKITGGTIHYKDYRREASDIPLLLLHGAGSMYLDWPIQLRKGAGAIALDLPGHGRSTAPARTRVEDYAADVVAFLDALSLERVVLAGHSMGGAIAQTIALDYGDYLRGLILVGTGAKLDVNPMIIEGLLSKPEETAALLVKWEWAKHISADIKAQSLNRLLETPAEVTQGDYIACSAFDVRARLPEITIPTLILAGGVDKMTPLALSEELAAAIPHTKLEILEGGGHMFPLEQPERTTEIISAWLESL